MRDKDLKALASEMVQSYDTISEPLLNQQLSDVKIIAAVDEITRQLVNTQLEPNELPIPSGAQCHRSTTGLVRRAWEKSRKLYLKQTGIDVLDAIKRHEAWLRNEQNAPVLYIEKR